MNPFKSEKSARYFYFFIVLIGLFFRWYAIGVRPLHHDESIHVMFGRYYFDHPGVNYYKYNPEYHGPLLYSLLRFVYDVFGDTEATARGLLAIMGSAYIFLPWLFRRYLSQGMVLILTAAIAISPTLIYWSRFVREDFFVLSGMILVLYGIFCASDRQKAFWVLLGAVFQYASKENSYVTLALIWAYLIFEYIYRRVVTGLREPIPFFFFAPLPFAAVILLKLGMVQDGTALRVESYLPMHLAAALGAILFLLDAVRPKLEPRSENTIAYSYLSYLSRYRYEFFISLGMAAFLFSYLFSAGFQYPEGILDGLYRKGITYWVEKHNIERIKGPFLFHFYTLTWYEFCFIIAMVFHAVCFYRAASRGALFAAGGAVVLAFILSYVNLDSTAEGEKAFTFFLWKALKVKNYLDVFGAIILIAHPPIVVFEHLRKKEWRLAFWAYWFLGSFFTYSFLGEKVPWLSIYPFTAGFIYLGLYFDTLYREGKQNWVNDSWAWGDIFLLSGSVLLGLGVLFTIEEWVRFSELRPGEVFLFQNLIKANTPCFIFGIALIAFGYLENSWAQFERVPAAMLLFVAFLLFNLRATVLTNLDFQYREIGYISQVHTTHDIVRVANRIRNEIETKAQSQDVSVLVTGDAVWPLTWYLRDLPTYKFSASEEEKKNFTYIIQNTDDKIPENFFSRQINLRGWWVPEFQNMTFKRFLMYSLTLHGWGGPGYSVVNLLTRK